MTPKVIRDGLVAVLVSPGWGAGWSTWIRGDYRERAVFDPELVAAVEGGDHAEIQRVAQANYPNEYLGGLRDIEVAWLPEGTPFTIVENDGFELIYRGDRLEYTA